MIYSSRRAVVGSRFAARRAGSQHAIAEIRKKTAAIVAKVAGVGGLYAHQHGGHSACEGEGDDQTGGDTDGREAQSLPHYELEDLARPGTEGHANTNCWIPPESTGRTHLASLVTLLAQSFPSCT